MKDKQIFVTAKDVKDALARRHSKDIFYTEVNTDFKDNPIGRLDAWAMRPSYSAPCLFGYEVKVSRYDFAQDHKLQSYAALCNELYVACAPGVVQSASELPEGCGWLEMQEWNDGFRLRLKRKAAFREVAIPEGFWRSLVLHHAAPEVASTSDAFAKNRYNANSVQEYLDGKRNYLNIGSRLAERVAEYERSDKELVEAAGHLACILRNKLGVLNFDKNLTMADVARIEERLNDILEVKDLVNQLEITRKKIDAFEERAQKEGF